MAEDLCRRVADPVSYLYDLSIKEEDHETGVGVVKAFLKEGILCAWKQLHGAWYSFRAGLICGYFACTSILLVLLMQYSGYVRCERNGWRTGAREHCWRYVLGNTGIPVLFGKVVLLDFFIILVVVDVLDTIVEEVSAVLSVAVDLGDSSSGMNNIFLKNFRTVGDQMFRRWPTVPSVLLPGWAFFSKKWG